MRYLLAIILLSSAATLQAVEPARVLLAGTCHFGNPGQGHANVQAVDATMPDRQAELQAVIFANPVAPTCCIRASSRNEGKCMAALARMHYLRNGIISPTLRAGCGHSW